LVTDTKLMEMAVWTLCFWHAAGHSRLRYNSLFVSLKTYHLLFPLVIIKYAACRNVQIPVASMTQFRPRAEIAWFYFRASCVCNHHYYLLLL